MSAESTAAHYINRYSSYPHVSAPDLRKQIFGVHEFLLPELQETLAEQNVPNPIRTTSLIESAGTLGHLEKPILSERELRALVELVQTVNPDVPIIIGEIPPKPEWRRIIEIIIKDEGFTDQKLLQIMPDRNYDLLTQVRRRKCAKAIVDAQTLQSVLKDKFEDMVRQKRIAVPQRYGFSALGQIRYIDWYSKLGIVLEDGGMWLHYILTPFGAFYTGNQH